MEQLREKIASLSADFAAGVMAAIRESSLEDLIGDRFNGSTRAAVSATDKPRRGPGRPPGPSKKTGRLARRSAEDIDEMADKIVAYVKQAGVPMRAEAVRAALAIDKKEWMKPLQLALDTKGLKKQGNKRATEYTVGGSAKAAPKGAKPAKKGKPAKAKAKAAPKKAKAKPAKAKAKPTKAKAKSNGAAKTKAPKKSKKKALAALDKHIESNGASSASAAAEA